MRMVSVFVLWALLLLASDAKRCQEEIPLPKSLTLNNGEVHIHGEFRAPLGEESEITFAVTVPSFFRFYLAEHELVDMDVKLYDSSSGLVDLSMSVWGEEMLADELPAGSYKILFSPFFEPEGENWSCESLEMEIAISPVTSLNARIAKLPKYTDTFVPPLTSSSINYILAHGSSYAYDSTEDQNSDLFNVKIDTSHIGFAPVYLAHWSIELVPKPGTNPLYDLEATLGYSFLSSGNLRLLVDADVDGGDSAYPPCEFAEDEEAQCKRGTSLVENYYTIQTKLSAGNYSIWLYELPDRRVGSITNIPFSLKLFIRQLHGEESFISCPQLLPPPSLNVPGLIDATGYLHYREETLLDLTRPVQTISFTVPSDFAFRVWIESHRVDIDLILAVRDGKQISRTFKTSEQEESILATGQANVEYVLTLKFYGRYDALFCETFLLEILILPHTPYYAFDYCQTMSSESKPVISKSLVNLAETFLLPHQEYHYKWNDTVQRHTDVILSVPISVAASHPGMILRAELESHFLSGLTLFIRSTDHNKNSTSRAFNYMDGGSLYHLLESGRNYTLVLSGAVAAKGDVSLLAPCAYFSFEMSITALTAELTSGCAGGKTLPRATTMSGPRYFGSSNRIHFQDIFIVPAPQSPFDSKDSFSFTVRQKSLLRAYTESRVMNGHDIDIDFSLLENGLAVEHEVKEEGEEKISYVLQAGKNYEFRANFVADFSLLPECVEWNLEFEVAPIFDDGGSTPSCTVHLPSPDDPIGIHSLVYEFTSVEDYAFEQSASPLTIKIPVIISSGEGMTDIIYFRAVVYYDFVWSDLSVRLLNENGELIALGQNRYNKNEIEPVQLAAGHYILELFEPEALEQAELHHCSLFTLSIGAAPHASNQIEIYVEEQEEVCPFLGLPYSWNAAPAIHPLNDYTVHEARYFRQSGNQNMVVFKVTEASFFRAFVPALDLFDVDIYIQNVDDEADPQTLARGTSFHQEENLFVRLKAGKYRVVFKYYFFPDDERCNYFPAEIGVVTEDYVNKHLALKQNDHLCEGVPTPELGPFQKGSWVTADFHRTAAAPFHTTATFKVTETSVFKAVLTYTFFTGHLFFTVTGQNIVSPYASAGKDKVIPAWIGEDVAFFDHLLFPGDYNITLDDEFSYANSTVPEFCTSFSLSYILTPGHPDDYCDDADTLPQDLFTYYGGSQHYGGPQARDGTIRISGMNFIFPEYRSHSDIAFRIKEPSFLRVWAKYESEEENDIDFLIWRNKEKEELVSASAGSESVESHIIFLTPQDEPYVLDLFVYELKLKDCQFFHFELAIETNKSIADRLLCPDPLPSPPLPASTFAIRESSITLEREMNVFTGEFINANKKSFFLYELVEYEISFTAPSSGNYFFFAVIGFDFVLSDMSMYLTAGENKTIIANSSPEMSPGTEDYFVDFESWLEAELSPGPHSLVIVEKLYDLDQHPRTRGMCDKFSFLLGMDALGTSETFHIQHVLPPEGADIPADAGLVVEITFSAPLDTTALSLSWIRTHNLFILWDITATPTAVVAPSSYVMDSKDEVITLLFYPLTAGHTYNLNITSSLLRDTTGAVLREYTETHTYSTFSCFCGEHGTCVTDENNTHTRCECAFPYGGPLCTLCEVGYHRSNTICVKDIECTKDHCGPHGTCNDDGGYPSCACQEGYESDEHGFCNVCHRGYTKNEEGNCEKEGSGRSNHCSIPLLPTSLDSVAFLEFDDRTHFQGDYFIDTVHNEHKLEFTLTKESYLRVYAEPHEIDIDFWLSLKGQDGNLQLIAYAISFNEEETIFRKLPAGTYVLLFQFLSFQKLVGDCHSFNFELAIAPVTEFKAEVDAFRSKCPRASVLPIVDLKTISKDSTKWGEDETVFYVLPPTTTSLDDPKGLSYDFWSVDFTVPENGNNVLVFNLNLAYKFMTGDVACRLERTDIASDDEKISAVFGFNGFNRHHLRHYVQEGSYRLVLYLPVGLNSSYVPCTPFTLNFNTDWITKEEDIFSCPHPALPADFNAPSLADKPGLVRLIDRFLVEEWSSSFTFTATELSVLRIDVTSEIYFEYQVSRKVGQDWRLVLSDTAGEVYTPNLVAGEYKVAFTFEYLSSFVFCPSLDLEFVLMPRVEVVEGLSHFNCPSGHIATLPSLPSRPVYGSGTLPFLYDGLDGDKKERVFYAFPSTGDEIFAWHFQVADTVLFEAIVGSYFISSNIRAEVISVSNSKNVTFFSDSVGFNFNRLVLELEPGSYILRLTQYDSPDLPLASCSPYSFTLSIREADEWRRTEHCEDEDVLEVLEFPTNFNLLRYAGFDRSMKIHSDNWLVPRNLTGHITHVHHTFLTVEERSLFRAYVEEHTIDIDIAIFAADAEGKIISTNSPLASGFNGFSEESFVITLDAGSYVFEITFWNWELAELKCSTFHMEIALSPWDHLPSRSPHCLDSKGRESLFPSVPSSLDKASLPYVKDYAGYYQQIAHNDYQHPLVTYNVHFSTDFDIHIELGYSFIVGDLVLSFSGEGDNFVQYGENEYARNVLVRRDNPAGNYQITIYEATTNDVDALACSDFSFFLFVDVPKQNVVQVEMQDNGWLTSSLNLLPYLLYSDELKLHESGFLVHASDLNIAKEVFMDIRKTSLIHVVIDGGQTSSPPFTANLASTEPKSSDILAVLPVGSHYISFYPTHSSPALFGTIILANIHISVTPFDAFQTNLAKVCAHSASAWVPPTITVRATDGYYHYREMHARLTTAQATTKGTMFSIPFEVEKDTIFSAQIYSELLVGGYQLQLTGDSHGVHNGINDFNSNDLQAFIAPGSYQLLIVNPVAWPAGASYTPPCSEFQIRISISAADSTTDRVDCSSSDIFPWDFMTPTGGSQPYGGPVDDGLLHLWSDRFLMNGDGTELVSTFSISTPSIVSMFATQDTYTDLHLQLAKSGSATSVVPYTEYRSWQQQVVLFKLFPITGLTQYDLKITYEPNHWVSCVQFGFGFDLAPLSNVERFLTNSCNGKHELPPKNLINSVYEIDSHFTYADIQANSVNDTFIYAMDIQISKNTDLDVSFSYSPLSGIFVIKLYYQSGSRWNLYQEGMWSPLAENGFSASQTMSITLDTYSTDYRLTIELDRVPVTPTPSQTFCFPYELIVQLSGRDAVTSPFVRYVEPSRGEGLNAERDFFLELRFSESLFFKTPEGTLRKVDNRVKDTRTKMTKIIYLEDESLPTHNKIYPADAREPEDNLNPDDYLRWTFTFGAKDLLPGENYHLKLEDKVLFNAAGQAVVLKTTHDYKTAQVDTKCNGFGTYNDKTKKCICNPGSHREGPTCLLCENGFHVENGVCVRFSGCKPDSCNCGPTSTEGHCEPLGSCTPGLDGTSITCTCISAKYTGLTCEKCSAGFENYPTCTPSKCPSCVHGTCDNAVCKCDPHWEGTACDKCAPGFTGSLCEEEHGIAKTVGILLVVVIVAVLIGCGIYYFVKNKKRTGEEYGSVVTNDDILLEGMGGTQFGGVQSDSEELSGSSSGPQQDAVELSSSVESS